MTGLYKFISMNYNRFAGFDVYTISRLIKWQDAEKLLFPNLSLDKD